MKKTLTILWALIVIGTIFIAITVSKPKSHPNGIQIESTGQSTDSQEQIPEEINQISPPGTTEKPFTYFEYIKNGDTYLNNQNYELAIASYLGALELNPNSAEPLVKLGEAYLKNNEHKNAEDAFTRAQKFEPTSTNIALGVARSKLNQRDFEGAKKIIWSLDQNDLNVKYYQAIILMIGNDPAGAELILKEISKSENVPPDLKNNTEKFLYAFDTFSYYREGESIHLQLLLAKVFTEVGEYEPSIPILFRIIEGKNNYRDAWITLGYAYLKAGKITDAIDSLNQALVLDETKPETLFFLGLAYFANNDFEKAITLIESADKAGFQPKELIYLKLGDLYLLQGDYEKSSINYEKVVAINPTNLGLFVRTMWLNIEKLDNTKKAIALGEEALKFHPQDPMSYNLAGWAYTADGNFTTAKSYLTKALELNPQFDAANLNLGWLYEKQGATTLAKEYYKKAYLLGNGNTIATLAEQRFTNLQPSLQANK